MTRPRRFPQRSRWEVLAEQLTAFRTQKLHLEQKIKEITDEMEAIEDAYIARHPELDLDEIDALIRRTRGAA